MQICNPTKSLSKISEEYPIQSLSG